MLRLLDGQPLVSCKAKVCKPPRRGASGMTTGFRAWLSGFVPPTGISRRLVTVTFVQAIGTGTYLSVSTIYFVKIVGIPAFQVAAGLSLAGLLGFVASVPAGLLADRVGAKKPLLAHYGLLAVLFPLYSIANSFVLFLVLACLIGFVQVAGSPLRAALTYSLVTGPEAAQARAQMRSSFNLGLAIGTSLAGLALAVGTPFVFLLVLFGNGAAQAVCAVLIGRLPSPKLQPKPEPSLKRVPRTGLPVWRNFRFIAVTVCCGVLEMFDSVWSIGVPLWIVSHTRAPAWAVAVVLLVGSTLVIALQVVAAQRAATIATAARSLRTAGFALAGACLVFALSAARPAAVAVAILMAGAVLLALGEILQSAGAWTLSYELPPRGRQGEYQGVFGLARGLQQTLGPVLIAATTVALAERGWFVLAILFILAGLGGWRSARQASI